MNQKVHYYRAEIGATLLPSIKICVTTGMVLFVAIAFKNQFENLTKVLQATLLFESVMLPFMFLLMVGFTFDYKITIYFDGISSYDPFGSRKCDFMLWSSMSRVIRKSVIGYQYYVVENKNTGERVWIPCKIKNKEDFIKTLYARAGASNVLHEELVKV